MTEDKNNNLDELIEKKFPNYPFEIIRTRKQKFKRKKTATIIVHLMEGRDLLAMDSILEGGKSDPYARVTIGETTLESSRRKKTLDPIWKDELVFQIMNENSESTSKIKIPKLKIELFDEDHSIKNIKKGKKQKDDPMGTVVINLSRIIRNGALGKDNACWYPVKHPTNPDEYAGEILVAIEAQDLDAI